MPLSDNFILRLVRVALTVFWLGVGVAALLASLASHPELPTRAVRLNFLSVLPQGWAFFTRDAREPALRIYQRADDGRWARADHPNADPINLFGFSKAGRAMMAQTMPAAMLVPRAHWHACTAGLAACTRNSAPVAVDTVRLPATAPVTICGNVLLEKQPPVPWAWSARASRIYMPSSIATVYIRCGDRA